MIPSTKITFDLRRDEKYATPSVKIKAVTSVATSGIVAMAASVVRDPYINVPYSRSIPHPMTTSAKYLSRSEKENAVPMITKEAKKPTPRRMVSLMAAQTLV